MTEVFEQQSSASFRQCSGLHLPALTQLRARSASVAAASALQRHQLLLGLKHVAGPQLPAGGLTERYLQNAHAETTS